MAYEKVLEWLKSLQPEIALKNGCNRKDLEKIAVYMRALGISPDVDAFQIG